MNKKIYILLMVILFITLAGCGKSSPHKNEIIKTNKINKTKHIKLIDENLINKLATQDLYYKSTILPNNTPIVIMPYEKKLEKPLKLYLMFKLFLFATQNGLI